MTKRLQSDVKRRANGLLSSLDIEEVDRRLVLRARCATFYGVQMAIAAIEGFVADFPDSAPATAEFVVGGRHLLLHDPFTTPKPTGQRVVESSSEVHQWSPRSERQASPKSRRRKTYETAESMVAVGV